MKLENQPRIISLDPTCIEDVFSNIRTVGRAAGVEATAERYVESLDRRVQRVKSIAALADHRPKVACIEWFDPVMVAGHWVPQMVEMAGGQDCLGDKDKPTFTIAWDKVVEQQPDVIMLCPCGFDLPRTLQVFAVDGSAYFNRSGPRLINGLEILAEIIHPELFSGMVPQGGASRIWR